MKKRKVIGIGAAVLVMLLSIIPVVNAVSIETRNIEYEKDSYDTNDLDKITDAIIKYEKEIREIESYIEEYIEKYGYLDDNFELPYELQEKYETILKEGNIENPEQTEISKKAYTFYPKFETMIDKIYKLLKIDFKNPYVTPTVGGGKTDYKRFWIVPYVAYVDQIWIDSTTLFWICKTIGPIGFAAIGIALTLSGVGAPIAIGFAVGSLLSGFGLDQLYEMGRETGIYAEITELFMYDTIPPILTYIGPQYGET